LPASRPPSECPVCGADVPAKARACPECGADEKSGWDEEATRYDGLDLPTDPDEDKPSRAWSNREENRHRPAPFWWAVGLILTGVLIYLLVRAAL